MTSEIPSSKAFILLISPELVEVAIKSFGLETLGAVWREVRDVAF